MIGHRSQCTQIIIIGQRALLREGLAALLQCTPYKVIASAPRASELQDLHTPADRRTLVLMGIDDDNETETAEGIGLLRSRFSDCRIVLVAETRGPTDMQLITTLGPNCYIANLGSRDILVKVLELALLEQRVIVLSRSTPAPKANDHNEPDRRVSAVNSPIGLQNSPVVAIAAGDPLLSQRERQVLFRLAEGASNKEIARFCNITESTVKVHLKAILRKISVHNRTQAAIWAVARGYHDGSGSSGYPIKPMDGLERPSPLNTLRPTNRNGGVPLHAGTIRK